METTKQIEHVLGKGSEHVSESIVQGVLNGINDSGEEEETIPDTIDTVDSILHNPEIEEGLTLKQGIIVAAVVLLLGVVIYAVTNRKTRMQVEEIV